MKLKGFYSSFAVVSLLGLILSIVSLRSSIILEFNPGYESFCNINETFNCDKVLKSEFSSLFGLPNSAYGAVLYFAALLISIAGIYFMSAELVSVLTLFTLGHLLFAFALFLLSKFVLYTFCLICIGIYIVALLYVLLIFLVREGPAFKCRICESFKTLADSSGMILGLGRFKGTSQSNFAAISFAIFLVGSIALVAVPYKIWGKGLISVSSVKVGDETSKELDQWRMGEEFKFITDGDAAGNTGSIGPVTAPVQMVEFADYECPACRSASPLLKEIISKYPDSVRATFKQYPLDNSCNRNMNRELHLHACLAAKVAICSKSLGKFMEVSEMLYKIPELTEGVSKEKGSLAIFRGLSDLGIDTAKVSECLASDEVTKQLTSEINEGEKAKLNGTPSLYINNRKVPSFRKDLIIKIIDDILAKAAKI